MSADQEKKDSEELEQQYLELLRKNFRSAYNVHGKGVGKLEIDKALTSRAWTHATRKLVKDLRNTYPSKRLKDTPSNS